MNSDIIIGLIAILLAYLLLYFRYCDKPVRRNAPRTRNVRRNPSKYPRYLHVSKKVTGRDMHIANTYGLRFWQWFTKGIGSTYNVGNNIRKRNQRNGN